MESTKGLDYDTLLLRPNLIPEQASLPGEKKNEKKKKRERIKEGSIASEQKIMHGASAKVLRFDS